MPLRKQWADVVFREGLGQRSDDKLVVATKLLRLRNGYLPKTGRVQKRNGSASLGTTVYRKTDGDTLPYTGPVADAESLAVLGDELLLYTADYCLSRMDGDSKWAYKSLATSCNCSAVAISDNPYDHHDVQAIYSNGFRFYVWREEGPSQDNINYAIEDAVTGNRVISEGLIELTSPNGSKYHHLVTVGDEVVALWDKDLGGASPAIRRSKIDASANIGTTPWDTPGDLLSIDPDHWDAIPDGRDTHFYVVSDEGGLINSRRMTTSWTTTASRSAAGGPVSAIACYYDETNKDLVIVWAEDSGGDTLIRTTIFERDLGATQLVATTLATITGQNDACVRIAIGPGHVVTSYTAIVELIPQAHAGAPTADLYREVRFLDFARTGGANTKTVHSLFDMSLGSKTFVEGSHVFFVGIRPADTIGTTVQFSTQALFRYELSGVDPGEGEDHLIVLPGIVGKFREDLGGGIRAQNSIADLNNDDDTDSYLFGLQLAASIGFQTDSGKPVRTDRLVASRGLIDFGDDRRRFARTEHNGGLHVTGGMLHLYDRREHYDFGWVKPPMIAAVSVATTGGLVVDGSYEYVAVYEWYDAEGQLHRSAPSASFAVTAAAASNTNVLTVTIARYTYSPKNTRIALYRTLIGPGTIFYRVNSQDYGTVGGGGSTVAVATVADGQADSTISDDEILYTDGDVLENHCPPSCAALAVHRDRVLLSNFEEPNSVWFSKSTVPGEGVSFNGNLKVPVGGETDRAIAMVSMDGQTIVLKRHSLWRIFGEFPNDLGQGATLVTSRIPVGDVGCISEKSVALVPQGILFQADAGIHLLKRDMTLAFVGKDVEDLTDGDTVVDAVIVADKKQVRFRLQDDTTDSVLVLDYETGQWSTSDNHDGAEAGAAVLWRTFYCHAKTDGNVWQEDSGWDEPDTTKVAMSVQTAWIKPSEHVQGYGRVRKILVLGEYKGVHDLKVELELNYNGGTIVDTSTWDQVALAAMAPYQLEMRPSIQKCESFRLTITEDYTSEAASQGVELNALMVEFGVKPEVMRLSTASGTRK